MKQIFTKAGKIISEELPVPSIGDNEILVKVAYSAISAGTEMNAVNSSGKSLFHKVIDKPENIKKALQELKKKGFRKTVKKVKKKVEGKTPIGYSASGIVIEKGKDTGAIEIGDKVACAGAGVANHAEYITVPKNLFVKVPQGLSLKNASTVTLGSIAMQGVRRTRPGLGETVVVVGLGIIGQLIAQLIKNCGCKIVGIDLDNRRLKLAESSEIDKAYNPKNTDIVSEVNEYTEGYGADSVVITASTESSEVINQAMEMCRKKGKVVIVGAIGLDLKRKKFYEKELDLLISTSYGPGRYDKNYEEKGLDYPYAYVRWTENRNMKEYLKLINEEKLNLDSLIEKIYPLEEIEEAYENYKKSKDKPLITILEYEKENKKEKKIIVSSKKILKSKINVGLIGAGGFSKGVLLPKLKNLDNYYNIHAIASKTGKSAKEVADSYKAHYATSNYKEILNDEEIDMVIISTRHNLHAKIAVDAALQEKAVFLEKPLAINEEELRKIEETLQDKKVPFMVGYNRRFSPYIRKVKNLVKKKNNPLIINYRMNAGYIPKEHWTQQKKVGGGRNIGETCHIYDLFTYLTDSEVKSIYAESINPQSEKYLKNDNFTATIKYKDGSVCNLIYTAMGNKQEPKEKMDVYYDNKIIKLNDYKLLEFVGINKSNYSTKRQKKGHLEELKRFADSAKQSNGYPIPLWQLIQTSNISFTIENEIG